MYYNIEYPPPPTNNNEFTYTAVEKRDWPIAGIDNPHKCTHIVVDEPVKTQRCMVVETKK